MNGYLSRRGLLGWMLAACGGMLAGRLGTRVDVPSSDRAEPASRSATGATFSTSPIYVGTAALIIQTTYDKQGRVVARSEWPDGDRGHGGVGFGCPGHELLSFLSPE